MLNATPSSHGEPGGAHQTTRVWPPAPIADLDAAGALRAALDKGASAALWALADAMPLWWNEAGGTLFDLPGSGHGAGEVAAALRRAARSPRPWLEMRRVSRGITSSAVTLLLRRVRLTDGRDALLAVATALAPPLAAGRAVTPPPMPSPPDEQSLEASPLDDNGGPPTATRRLTWQTDAMGRLLAGPGASLSQALGRGAPMQSALLGDLLRPDGGAVGAAIAAGRPFARLPVETLPDAEGVSFQGLIFGAPVLDRERRPAGYRGFLVVTGEKHAPTDAKEASTPAPDGHEDRDDKLSPAAEAHHEPAEFSDASWPAAADRAGHAGVATAAPPASPIEDGVDPAVRELVPPSGEAKPDNPSSLAAAAESDEVAAEAAPGGDVVRASNVVSLWPSGVEARGKDHAGKDHAGKDHAGKDHAGAGLSPAERDAFADIAKALGANWTTRGHVSLAAPVPLNEVDAFARPDRFADAVATHARDGGEEPGTAPDAPADGFHAASSGDLAAIIDRLPVGVVIHRAGAAIAVNRTLLALLGRHDTRDFEAHGGLDGLFVDGASPAGKRAVAIRGADGEIVPVEARCQAIKLGGEPATLLSLRRALAGENDARDDDHWRAIAAKDDEIGELRATLAGAADGVVTLDGLGRILAMNAPAQALFGYDAKEVAGEALAALLAPESHGAVKEALRKALSAEPAEAPGPVDVTGRAREGRPMALSMKLVRGVGEAPAVRLHAILRDLTAVRDSQAGLVEARARAERLSAQKSEFLAKVSHEIRTPLNSIVGFADIIAEERFGPLSNQRYKEYIADIRASGAHIISLVNDLLDLSKIEAGRIELNFTNVNLNAEAAAAAASVQTGAAQARVLMRQSLAKSLPVVLADARSVKQIVLNLLSNAVKFTDPGGQVILSTAHSDNGEVILRVRDTGIGMSERQLAEAMQPFKQFATTTRPGGSGLGLSLTKALVKANHARLSINSSTGEGTFIEVIFPQGRVVGV